MTNKKAAKASKKSTQVKINAKKVTKVVTPTTKKCPKCGKTLPIKDFPHDFRRKDGLYIYCRTCEAARQYDKHTRNIVKNAEENGYVVLKVNTAAPTLSIDVLKIDVNPTTDRTIETTLAPTN
jgi:tRNA(Ile2) C34 agmatinyltransferase TiaS